jgi:hypothetical protein
MPLKQFYDFIIITTIYVCISSIILNNYSLNKENQEFKNIFEMIIEQDEEMKPIIDKLLLKDIKLYKKKNLNIKDLNYQWKAYEFFEVIYPNIEYNDNKIQVYRKLGKINCILDLIEAHLQEIKERIIPVEKTSLIIYSLNTEFSE